MVNISTQTNEISLADIEKLDLDKECINTLNNINIQNSEELINEVSSSSNNSINNYPIENLDINANFINIVRTLNPISKNDITILKIKGDGNCFYRCLSFFLLGNDEFYEDIKNEIINWIDNNRETFNDFLEMMI